MGIYKVKNIGHLSKDKNTILREGYDPERLKELRNSLKTHGYLPEHPMIVTLGGIILDGNTRYDLCMELNIKEIPVVEISGKNMMVALERQLIGILLRKDLEPIEKAKALKKYIDLSLKKQKKLSSPANSEDLEPLLKPLGISVARYRNISKVLSKKDVVKEVEEGNMSMSHGEEVARIDDEETRKEVIDKTKENNMTREEVRSEVSEIVEDAQITHEEALQDGSTLLSGEGEQQTDSKPKTDKKPKKPENDDVLICKQLSGKRGMKIMKNLVAKDTKPFGDNKYCELSLQMLAKITLHMADPEAYKNVKFDKDFYDKLNGITSKISSNLLKIESNLKDRINNIGG